MKINIAKQLTKRRSKTFSSNM